MQPSIIPPRKGKALKVPALKSITFGKTPLHDSLGVSPEFTRGEYMKVVNQDDHLPSKLKALAPLARELGLEAEPEFARNTQNIIIMMPQEIVQKHQLTVNPKIIDVEKQ